VDLLKKLKKENRSFVLDADALKLVKNHLDLIKGQRVILTPHEGELKIMTGVELPPYNHLEERCKIIKDLAQKLEVTLLLKGVFDIISNGKDVKINQTGCPEMAIGGTGDILAGLCTCFLAMENPPFQSACAAAFFNGFLGEFSKKKHLGRFTSTDMINNISMALNELKQLKTQLKKFSL